MRTGRRGRVPAIYPLSVYDDSPTGTDPDIPTYHPRNFRKKRIDVTSTQDPTPPALKEPVVEAVPATNVTIPPAGAAPAPAPSSADAKAAKKREKARKKKIEKAQKAAANITRRLGDTGTGSPKFDPIIDTLRAR